MKLIRPLTVAFAIVAALSIAGPAQAQAVLGEWVLVEQSYGEGKSNLVREAVRPVRLEFYRQGPEIKAKIHPADGEGEAQAWPRLAADPARTVHVEEQRFSVSGDHVFARYRVDPSPGDDLVLIVTEEYGVVEDGKALVGTVRVEFRRDGEDRGSYLLRRRFERRR